MDFESEDVTSQLVQAKETPKLLSADSVQQHSQEEIEQSKIHHKSLTDSLQPGFTLCWDNVRKRVVTRHPTATTTNSYINMALSYMAINKVFTTHLPNTDITVLQRLEIPVEAFVLHEKDFHAIGQECYCLQNSDSAYHMVQGKFF